MAAITISREVYRDKVHGGWLGKNIGETLGASGEGSRETNDLKFFDPDPGQAAAFDGLDFQLVWLHTLREKGADVTSDDLAAAWQQNLTYPWDEYGYALNNLRRNLRPAMTGSFDNWFRNGTRGAARCDVWGMIAPGCPQAAAQAAYRDASIDHSEDGIWAAMFWAAVESAAFVVPDIFRLIEIGLAMVPPDCRVARAVRIALDAFRQDATPIDARGRIINAVGSENYTDSPQNTGFAVIGWLYGKGDFGAALTTAVNCGYASQFTGGVLGAVLGILQGRQGIPATWLEPVGEAVVLGWGVVGLDVERTVEELTDHTVAIGERFVAARCPDVTIGDSAIVPLPPDSHVIPATEPGEAAAAPAASELTAPAESAPRHFLELDSTPAASQSAPTEAPATEPDLLQPPQTEAPPTESAPSDFTPLSTPESTVPTPLSSEVAAPPAAELETSPAAEAPPAPEPQTPASPAVNWTDNSIVQPLWTTPSSVAVYTSGDFQFAVDFGAAGPIILPGVATSFTVAVRNLGSQDFMGQVTINAPQGWQVAVPGAQGQRQMLAQGRMARYGFVIKAPEDAPLKTRNAVTIVMTPEKAAATTVEIPLLGGSCWWFVGPFRNLADEGYDHAYGPEDNQALDKDFLARDGGLIKWQRMAFGSTVMDLERLFTGVPGVAYGQTLLFLNEPVKARIIVHSNDGAKVWLNGTRILQRHSHEPFRPTLGYGPAQADVDLKAGDNKVLLKVVRCGAPIDLSFVAADREGKPLPELGNTRWSV